MSHLQKTYPTTFSKFYGDEVTSDVVLNFYGEKFFVHKIILASHSDVFYTLFFQKNFCEEMKKEVIIENSIEGVDKTIFGSFLKYLYTSEIIVNEKNVVKLFELSDYYCVGHLKEICLSSLYEEIKKGDYFPALEMLNKYYDEELLRLCLSVISRNVHRHSFVGHFCENVSCQSVIRVLSNDYFNVGEETVLKIALKYLEIHPPQNEEDAKQILNCVRFHLMSGENIVKHMEPLVEKGWVEQKSFTNALVYKFDKKKIKVKARRIGFTWDVEDMKAFHESFIVSEDNLVVKRNKSSGVNPSIRTKIPLTRKNPLFRAKMLVFNKWNCFGVCSKSFKLTNEFVGNDTNPDSGFGIYIGGTSNNCYVKNASQSVVFNIKPAIIKEGDELAIRLTEENKMEFLLNGNLLGKADLENSKIVYYPSISIGYLSEWKILT